MISVKKQKLLLFLSVLPGVFVAQPTQSSEGGANPLLWLLIGIIILLAFAIAAVASAIRNISNSSARNDEEKSPPPNRTKITSTVIAFILLSNVLSAKPIGGYSGAEDVAGIPFSQFYFLTVVIIIELLFLISLLSVLKLRLPPYEKAKAVTAVKTKEKTILEKINASVDIEHESNILLDHEYDGIKELDNNLPPWWRYCFYLTIVFAVVYMIHYHVTKTGDLQTAELEKNIAEAKLQITDYLKASANNVDELTVKYMNNPSDLGYGKDIFTNSCAACHGMKGEGGVGPNLTDDYWVHGGSISDIFKSVKYGWTDKGMKSWKDELSPIKIAQVSSFIKSLRGTNPPNQKEKQGDLYVDNGTVLPSDSLNLPMEKK